MVCRQYRLSSTVIAQVRTASWLDDAQIQSIYHTALHDPEIYGTNIDGWNRDQILTTVISRARADIRCNPIYRPQRRAGLSNRLETNLDTEMGQMPRERLSALLRLPQVTAEAEHQLTSRLREIAGRRGMSEREARQEFYELRSQAPAGRQPRATGAERADLGLIPSDPATRFALVAMESRGPVRVPIREVDQWISVAPGPADPSATIAEIGVSTVSDRIELRYVDAHVDAHRAHSYADVDTLIARSRTGRFTQADAAACAGLPPVPRADRTGWRVRCDECGQFVGARPHQCRDRVRVEGHLECRQLHNGGQLVCPETRDIQQILSASQDTGTPVEIPVTYTGPAVLDDAPGAVTVAGMVRVRPGADAIADMESRNIANLSFDEGGLDDTLRCERCGSTTCEHASHTRAVLHQHLRHSGGEESRQQRTAISQATFIALHQRPSTPSPQAAPATPAAPATLVFNQDPEQFRTFARLGAGDGVPFYERPIFTGYAAGVGSESTRFGVELEYTGEYRRRIHDAIMSSGLVRAARGGYHSTARRRWRGWGLENDSTVDGELVTPILNDTQSSWAQLRLACQTIREAGGRTDLAGSHVNISAGDMTPQQAFRLAHLFRAHQEDFARMGRTRGSQRDPHYNPPLPDPGMTAWTTRFAISYNRGEINFAHMNPEDPQSSRLEFRFPDASHDEGTIQAQINLCAALTNYCRTTDDVTIGDHQERGMHRRARRAARFMSLPEAEWATHTQAIRTLICTLFDTDQDREQMARLWGRGNFY